MKHTETIFYLITENSNMTDAGKIYFVEQRNYQNTLKSIKLNFKKETNKVLIIT